MRLLKLKVTSKNLSAAKGGPHSYIFATVFATLMPWHTVAAAQVAAPHPGSVSNLSSTAKSMSASSLNLSVYYEDYFCKWHQ